MGVPEKCKREKSVKEKMYLSDNEANLTKGIFPGTPGINELNQVYPECNGQDEGQNPSLPSICSPDTSVFVLHQEEPRSTVLHPLYTIPFT